MRISSKISASRFVILIAFVTVSSAQALGQDQVQASESLQKPAFYQPSTKEEKVAFMRSPGMFEYGKALAYEIPDPGYINAQYLLQIFEAAYGQCIKNDPPDLNESFKVLTETERAAICFYTGSYYQNIAVQISRLKSAAVANNLVIQALDSALAKLPTSPQKEVKHSQEVDPRMVPKLRPGFKFKVPQFLSCSKTDIRFGSTLEMIITHVNGKDISTISAVSYEEEVLLPRDSEFVVTKVESHQVDDESAIIEEDGRIRLKTAYRIWLKQLPEKESKSSK